LSLETVIVVVMDTEVDNFIEIPGFLLLSIGLLLHVSID
jgi:hypothetical protein